MATATYRRSEAEAARAHAHDALLVHPARAALEVYTGRPLEARVERNGPRACYGYDADWIRGQFTGDGHRIPHPTESAWSVIEGWVHETVPDGCSSHLVSVSGPHPGSFGWGDHHEATITVTDPDFGNYTLTLTVEWALA